MSQFKKILVTLDGSLLAEHALEPAMTLAQTMSAELVLLRVVTPIFFWAPFVEIEPTLEVARVRNEQRTAAYLEEVRDRLLQQDDSLSIQTVVLKGPVADAIVDFAKENSVDLIVISSHGRSGVGRWVYGSVAEKVLRGARCCSTLVVRGDLFERAGQSDEAQAGTAEHAPELQV